MWTELIHLFMHILILLRRFGRINTDEIVSKLEDDANGLKKEGKKTAGTAVFAVPVPIILRIK